MVGITVALVFCMGIPIVAKYLTAAEISGMRRRLQNNLSEIKRMREALKAIGKERNSALRHEQRLNVQRLRVKARTEMLREDLNRLREKNKKRIAA